MKHNKKRNTALLFEVLVTQLAKASSQNQEQEKRKIASIIKEFFCKKTEMGVELGLYRTMYETKSLDPVVAEKVISEAKSIHASVDKAKVWKQQSQLIDRINKELSPDVFSNFIKEYRLIASIWNLLNSDNVKTRIDHEAVLLESMACSDKKQRNLVEPLDNLTFNTFVNKFNEKYGQALNERQKSLIQNYIFSADDDKAVFLDYVNEELGNLKKEVAKAISSSEVSSDEDIKSKLKEVSTLLESFKTKKVTDDAVETILKVQGLVEEISK